MTSRLLSVQVILDCDCEGITHICTCTCVSLTHKHNAHMYMHVHVHVYTPITPAHNSCTHFCIMYVHMCCVWSACSTGVEAAMLKEQHGHKEETAHFEELISIARREHDKAVLQAQQVLLQAERERERLTQCAELEKARLREELDIATKKLHSIEAERNLLMVRVGSFMSCT